MVSRRLSAFRRNLEPGRSEFETQEKLEEALQAAHITYNNSSWNLLVVAQRSGRKTSKGKRRLV